jgi:hypothetical protein
MNCFLVYHETFFVVVLRKKEQAVDIEIFNGPNKSAQTKNNRSAKQKPERLHFKV